MKGLKPRPAARSAEAGAAGTSCHGSSLHDGLLQGSPWAPIPSTHHPVTHKQGWRPRTNPHKSPQTQGHRVTPSISMLHNLNRGYVLRVNFLFQWESKSNSRPGISSLSTVHLPTKSRVILMAKFSFLVCPQRRALWHHPVRELIRTTHRWQTLVRLRDLLWYRVKQTTKSSNDTSINFSYFGTNHNFPPPWYAAFCISWCLSAEPRKTINLPFINPWLPQANSPRQIISWAHIAGFSICRYLQDSPYSTLHTHVGFYLKANDP